MLADQAFSLLVFGDPVHDVQSPDFMLANRVQLSHGLHDHVAKAMEASLGESPAVLPPNKDGVIAFYCDKEVTQGVDDESSAERSIHCQARDAGAGR